MTDIAQERPRSRTPVRRSLGDLDERTLGFVLVLPVFLLLGLIVVYPIGRLIVTSFTDLALTRAGSGGFVGFLNYEDLWHDPQFWNALRVTVIYVVVTVPGALVAGLGLALLANLPFRRKWPVRLALLLPWALPLVFAGLIFRWFFESQFGVVNAVLGLFGLGPYLWLSTPGLAFAATCFAVVWKTSSFVALILLAGLQTIPRSLYEAAKVDGATDWQCFWRITLPMLQPAIAVALIFRTITAIQTFEIPYAMTQGGPGDATETLAMLIYKTTLDFTDFGYGSAMAVGLFLISMVATAFYLRQISAGGDR
jgi:multiple sugar transport system permease protein